MSQPTPYERQADFSDFSATNPSAQQPGVQLDAEFDALVVTLAQVLANLALIQRDDGKLADGAVHIDAMSAELIASIRQGLQAGLDAETPNFTFAFEELEPGEPGSLGVSGDYPDLLLTIRLPGGNDGQDGAGITNGDKGGVVVTDAGLPTENWAVRGQLPLSGGVMQGKFVAANPTADGATVNIGYGDLPLAADMADGDLVIHSSGMWGKFNGARFQFVTTGTLANYATVTYANDVGDAVEAFATARANHTGTQAISTVANLQSSLDAKAALYPTLVTKTASFTAATADHDRLMKLNAATARTLTLGSGAAVGTIFDARNIGAGAWTVNCAGGLFHNDQASVTTKTMPQNAQAVFIHEGSGVWRSRGAGLV